MTCLGTPSTCASSTGGAPNRQQRLPSVPEIRALSWRVFVDTAAPPPHDIHPDGTGPLVDVELPVELGERSLVCLIAAPASPEADTVPTPAVRRRIVLPDD